MRTHLLPLDPYPRLLRAVRHRWVDFNPAEHVEKLKADVSPDAHTIDGNILTPAEIGRLLDAAESPRWNREGRMIGNNHRLLIKVAVFTGMRAGEILGLQWGDVDWNSRQVHVRRSWKEGGFHAPKTAASIRRIDIPESIMAELREWKLSCPIGEYELVFPNLVGNPHSHTNLLQRVFYPTLRRAGLRKIRFHDLRHTFASLLIANGEDVVRVSRLLGHANPTITFLSKECNSRVSTDAMERFSRSILDRSRPCLASKARVSKA